MAVLRPLGEKQPRYTEEQIAEVVQWFDENSQPALKVGDELVHVITIQQLQSFLSTEKYHPRHFQYPTYNDIMKEVEALKMEKFRVFTIDQLLYLLDKWVIEPDPAAELKLAFEVFDTYEHGYLEIDEIRLAVTEQGQKFDVAEWIEFLRDANPDGFGKIDFNAFSDRMFQVEPDLYQIKKEFLYADPKEDPRFKPPEPEPVEEPVADAKSKFKRRQTTKRRGKEATENEQETQPDAETQANPETEAQPETEPKPAETETETPASPEQ